MKEKIDVFTNNAVKKFHYDNIYNWLGDIINLKIFYKIS